MVTMDSGDFGIEELIYLTDPTSRTHFFLVTWYFTSSIHEVDVPPPRFLARTTCASKLLSVAWSAEGQNLPRSLP